MVGLGNVDNTADVNKEVLSATKLTTARQINGVNFDGTANITIYDNTKAPVNSPTFTGNVSGITALMVGLGNVDNTRDADKYVYSASKLTTARQINGVNFDGTANVSVPPTQHKVLSSTYHSGFTISTSAPSGGVDGDIWFKVAA
jgi:hypothetical protein